MANGDDALAAGMDVVPATADRRQGYDEINKTRDYIAQRTNAVTPIAKGGTGSTNPAAARAALGIASQNIGRPGGDTVEDGLVWLGANKAGTGDLATVNAALGTKADDSNTVHKTGDTMTGPLGLGSAAPVTSGYSALYRNGDGRVGVSPSALRFKKDIHDHEYTLDDLLRIRVVSYRLRAALFDADDPNRAAPPTEVGVIAEELVTAGLSEFVVFDAEGQPLSVHYERLALVAIGAVQDLSHQLDTMAERITALEDNR